MIDSEGMAKIESWKNKKILISQENYENHKENEKEGKYSSEMIESYFTLFESLLVQKSNPLLDAEELCFAKQGSMNSGDQGQNNSEAQGSPNSSHQSRKPPGMEDKCMRCGKQEHQPGQKCPAKNAKCKACHKIGHFHCVCQSKKRAKQRANLIQSLQDDDDTYIDENGVRQPNPPRVNMFKLVNNIEANRRGKHLKFPIASHPKGPYKHHTVVRVDTGADVNCMNEKKYNFLYAPMRYRISKIQLQTFLLGV